MYKPLFNHVLVELEVDKWARGSDDSFGGEVYREGKLLKIGNCFATSDYPEFNPLGNLEDLVGKTIMWNEGHEAGKVFEHTTTNDKGESVTKKYALIYWWDIVGVKAEK